MMPKIDQHILAFMIGSVWMLVILHVLFGVGCNR